MDIERNFVSKVAMMGQIESALSTGVTDAHFASDSGRDIYSFLASHARQYKGAPSMEIVRERFPDYKFETTTDSLIYLTERFVREVKRRYAKNALLELSQVLDKDESADNIDGLFLGESRRLAQLMPTSKVHRFSEIDARIQAYENGEFQTRGIKMGIPDFDRLTLGVQPHEFVSIVGWQGLGKSTLTQWILFNAYMQQKTAMIISLEMEWSALMRKWDTMLTHFSYRDLKAGELSPEDVENWRIQAERVKERATSADIIVKDDVRSCTVDYVYAEAMRYQPDLLAVDYVSLMDTGRSNASQMWEKVTYITQQLKQVARTTGIPIIGVAQTNISSAESGAALDNIAYSRSIGQDSDIVLGLKQDEDQKENDQMTVKMLKNRDGSTAVADLLWMPDTMTFSPWNEVDFMRNKLKRQQREAENGE